MQIYLIDRNSNQTIKTYQNVLHWDINFVELVRNGLKSKYYCDPETQYFTDKETDKIFEQQI